MRGRENVNNRTATGGTERNAFYNVCFYNAWEKIIGWREREREKRIKPLLPVTRFSLSHHSSL